MLRALFHSESRFQKCRSLSIRVFDQEKNRDVFRVRKEERVIAILQQNSFPT